MNPFDSSTIMSSSLFNAPMLRREDGVVVQEPESVRTTWAQLLQGLRCFEEDTLGGGFTLCFEKDQAPTDDVTLGAPSFEYKGEFQRVTGSHWTQTNGQQGSIQVTITIKKLHASFFDHYPSKVMCGFFDANDIPLSVPSVVLAAADVSGATWQDQEIPVTSEACQREGVSANHLVRFAGAGSQSWTGRLIFDMGGVFERALDSELDVDCFIPSACRSHQQCQQPGIDDASA